MNKSRITSIPSSEVVGLGHKPADITAMPNRPTYTPSNAMAYKDVFDRMVDTQENQFISRSITGYSVNTLYIQANDALKWLMDNYAEKDKYAALRGAIKVSRRTDGILLYFKATMVNKMRQAIASSVTMSAAWKEELVKWLETAQPGDIFEQTNIVVTTEQKEWLIQLLSGVDGQPEVEVKDTSVRVMR